MGIIKYGIMGPVTNKVGTVIGRNFRGKNVITQLYQTSNRKATVHQMLQQERLATLSNFLAHAQPIVDPGFLKTTKPGQSPLNAAYSFNYPNAFAEEDNSIKLNFQKIILSQGPVERPNCATVARINNKILFSWLPQRDNQFTRNDDKASFLIYCMGENNRMIIVQHIVQRSDLQYEFDIKEKHLNDTFHCFMLFSSQNAKLVGTSEYLGQI